MTELSFEEKIRLCDKRLTEMGRMPIYGTDPSIYMPVIFGVVEELHMLRQIVKPVRRED